MSIDVGFLKEAIGKKVLDPYERIFGRIIGYHTDKKGSATKIGIQRSDGEIFSYPPSQFLLKNESVIFIYSWKIRSEDFTKRFNAASRKIWALDKLYERAEISQSHYVVAREQLEKSIRNTIEYGKKLLERLMFKADKLMTQIKDLEKYLISIRMQNVTGELGEEEYKSVSEALRIGIEKATLEKSDVDNVINIIKNVPQIPARRQIRTKAPEPLGSTSTLALRLENDETLIKTVRETIEQ